MDKEIVKITPQQEIKEKIRQTRADLSHAKKLANEIEKNHEKFIKIKDILNNKDNGIEANQKWISKQRDDVINSLKITKAKLEEFNALTNSVKKSVNDINLSFNKFKPLSIQIFDENNGLEAVLKATKKLKKATDTLSENIKTNSENASVELQNIIGTANDVNNAYNNFLEKKKLIDNEEDGFEAQLRKANEYTNSIQESKTKSETALVSISKFKDQSDELLLKIKNSKNAIETYQKESGNLTENIRNTLNKVTQFTLSKALQERAKSFSIQMWIWAFLQLISIAMLTCAVYYIFQVLFIGTIEHPAIVSNGSQTDFVLIISKFLFTTPLIFAVYVTTSNYSHARDLRDRYGWKETVAKNFQNYVILVKKEFKDKKYEEECFKFSMDTIRNIYKEPNQLPKRRKYNFSLKTIQLNIEEEDLRDLKEAISYNIPPVSSRQEDIIEEAIIRVADIVVDKDSDKNTTVKIDTPPTRK